MKTTLNLGLAFAAPSVRILSFQLVNERGYAVAIADYDGETLTRSMRAESLPADKFRAFIALTGQLSAPGAVKSLELSQATSDNATAYGYEDTGCWSVEIGLPGSPAHVVRAFPRNEWAKALEYAKALPFPWSASALKTHPEYAT